ncbi:hypothetical protein AB6D11_03180 [Vibrio splendidus]
MTKLLSALVYALLSFVLMAVAGLMIGIAKSHLLDHLSLGSLYLVLAVSCLVLISLLYRRGVAANFEQLMKRKSDDPELFAVWSAPIRMIKRVPVIVDAVLLIVSTILVPFAIYQAWGLEEPIIELAVISCCLALSITIGVDVLCRLFKNRDSVHKYEDKTA